MPSQEQFDYEVMRQLELRDYFAAKAMQGLVTREGAFYDEHVASWSYRIANAMIKERNKK